MFDEENRAWRATFVLGFSLVLSLVFLIVSGVVYHVWVPFVNIAAIVFLPAVVIIADSLGGDSSYQLDEVRQAYRNFGSCFLVRWSSECRRVAARLLGARSVHPGWC